MTGTRVFYFLLCTFITIGLTSRAQLTESQIRSTAIGFVKKNDFPNALLVLNNGLKSDPQSFLLLKELAFTYYLSGVFEKAAEIIAPLIQRDDADVQSYQIAANIYNGLEDWKKSEKIFRSGLRRFPRSGPLYSEYGQLLWGQEKTKEAIEQWEQGIIQDPAHAGNYYHASKFYFAAADKARAIVFGEMFVNLESFSQRTEEIKYLMFESYKRIFDPQDVKVHYIKKATEFEKRFLQIIQSSSAVVSNGIDVQALHALRSEFINAWFGTNDQIHPFALFGRLKYLADNAMFEAYNHWLFGSVSNQENHETWIREHQDAMILFLKFQHNNLFRPIIGQYYF